MSFKNKLNSATLWLLLRGFSFVSLFIAASGAGTMLVLHPSHWQHTGLLNTATVLLPAQLFGIALLIAAVLTLFTKVREYGFAIGGIVYGIFSACSIFALLNGAIASPLTFGVFAVTSLFFIAMVDSIDAQHG